VKKLFVFLFLAVLVFGCISQEVIYYNSTPTALTWSLTDDDGNVINSRTGVAIVTPGTSNAVVISGDDLKDDGEGRIFTLNGVYNSSTYGNNLPIKAQARFVIGKWIDVG